MDSLTSHTTFATRYRTSVPRNEMQSLSTRLNPMERAAKLTIAETKLLAGQAHGLFVRAETPLKRYNQPPFYLRD